MRAISRSVRRRSSTSCSASPRGDVDSADIANQVFKLSRQVRASKELSAEFDKDLEGLLDRVAASGSDDGKRFTAAVEAFMYMHGSRGPNEWDPYAWSYESNPMLLLQGIHIARSAGDDADPERALAVASAERQRLIDRFSEMFEDNPEALGSFQAAVSSTAARSVR